MSDPALVFLPWIARGGTIDLPPDRRDMHPASRISATAEVIINRTAPARIGVQLMGPGDVTALLPQQVIRTEPAPATRTFESNYLAAIEFDEPALPWLLTPASAKAAQLRPWLCLVVVKVGAGIRLDVSATGTLPVLRIGPPALPEQELPDLADSWAWAHGQVAPQTPGDAAITAALGGDPARNLSRLICGRLLAEQTEYLACVVPTFEAGRRSGLGLDPEGAEGPAWTLAPGMKPVELPVYYHWRFATGPTGDFQSLALAIRGRVSEEGLGSRPIDLSNAGLGLTGAADARVLLGGALRPLDTPPAVWSDPALSMRFATALTDILNAPDHVPAATPLLAPPRYGTAYRPVAALGPVGSTGWYEELNTNPANRIAAALGVQVVQRDQEVLVASAWDQAADMRAATALGRLADVGVAVAERIYARHLAPLAPETGVFVVAPLLRRLRPGASSGGTAIAGLFAGGDLTVHAFSATIRRATRVRGAAVRRAVQGSGAPPILKVATRMAEIAGPRRARVDVGPLATFEMLGSATPSVLATAWALIQPDAFADVPQRPGFAVRSPSFPASHPQPGIFTPLHVTRAATFGAALARARPQPLAKRRRPGFPDDFDPPDPVDPLDPPVHPHPPVRRDSAQAAAFRALAPVHLTKFLAPASPGGPGGTSLDLGTVFTQVIAMAAPRSTFAAALGEMLTNPAPTSDPANPPPAAAIPTDLSPRFAAPMANALAELGQEWFLPGLEGVPANTALALVTNSTFVQAFMIGLNHEFGRELLWREFPAPLNATFFQRFWDNAVDPTMPPDLEPLAARGERALDEDATPGDQFVLLVRSELLRRFPDAMVSAVRGSESRLPVFTGAMVPDVRYFGFAIPEGEATQWSVVIAEQPSAPRFGFEVGEAPPGVSHAPAPDPTSAALALRLRQLPARITIPVPVLLRKPAP
ncbi:hypothetical protein IAG41_06995 [Sphingomonas sp. JC676]|uniref:hypothetical protein n=1 Tax=Sphingomonas sp. JC676 TaxID=2768065 RepID=UPI001658238F|nr:hypothetical protein [Sphingomonas sp. JC676]MBC9032132.1 hypothetical protein [Sphingomonas sp. JC676]